MKSIDRRFSPAECRSVILARLTDKDFDALHAARLMFSASTGKNYRPGSGDHNAPYIATFAGELGNVLAALDWPCVRIVKHEHQWVVTRERRVRI